MNTSPTILTTEQLINTESSLTQNPTGYYDYNTTNNHYSFVIYLYCNESGSDFEQIQQYFDVNTSAYIVNATSNKGIIQLLTLV